MYISSCWYNQKDGIIIIPNRPISEQGALSELMAAVRYLPSLEGDGGVKIVFFFLIPLVSTSSLGLRLETAIDRTDPSRHSDDWKCSAS